MIASPLPAPGMNPVRAFLTDLGDAVRGVLHQAWFVAYALLFLIVALGLAWVTGDFSTWIGFNVGVTGVIGLVQAFFAYRGTRDPAAHAVAAEALTPVRHPAAETVIILAFIAAFVLVRTDQLLHGPFTTALFSLSNDPNWPDTAVIGVKLILNVLLPLGVFWALGYRRHDLALRWGKGWRLWPVFLIIGAPKLLGALTGQSGALLGLGHLAGSALYFFFAAGLPEELMHRVLLQRRLEAWWGSTNKALLVQAIVFALTHVPIRLIAGFSPLFIAGNLFLFVTGLGLLFGFIYTRTRALFPVAWIHALVDA